MLVEGIRDTRAQYLQYNWFSSVVKAIVKFSLVFGTVLKFLSWVRWQNYQKSVPLLFLSSVVAVSGSYFHCRSNNPI